MWRVREQLITIYTDDSPSIKIFKLVTYAQFLLQCLVNDLKGTKATHAYFFLVAQGKGETFDFPPF